jgi:cell division septum initiation protein DivIVA
MDENEAVAEQQLATPIFNVYRRGYDPEQVDRYVADQQRRLDDALRRASESERRLAAAVGQLRELHRRVAVYESETRSAQPPSLDTLGERVQRILQEAWEGAYTLRQEAEREVNELRETVAEEVSELREVASREAADVVDQATRRALAIRDETERRRHAYLQRVEQDRERAVSQITYLYDQRQDAIAELARLQTTVQAVVEEMARSPLGRPAPGVAVAAASPAATDGSPTLPPEDDMRLRPDRALGRSGVTVPAGPLDQPADATYRAGERAGRHSIPSGADFSPEYERNDVIEAGDARTLAEMQPTAEQLSPPRRSESLFDGEASEEEVPEASRSGRRRTGLFDAEQEGWT